MPAKAKQKGKNKNKKSKRNPFEGPSSSAIKYNGPLRLPRFKMNMDTIVAELSNSFTISSNGGGTFANVIANNLASYLDNTSYTALYDEYRSISMQATYYPNLSGGAQASVAYQVAYGVIDNDNSAALTTVSSAVDYASVKPFTLDQKMILTWKMNGTEDASFINNSGTATVWFKYYCTGLTASTSYGTIVVKTLFQFRGRI